MLTLLGLTLLGFRHEAPFVGTRNGASAAKPNLLESVNELFCQNSAYLHHDFTSSGPQSVVIVNWLTELSMSMS
jgi:hypothetical protein